MRPLRLVRLAIRDLRNLERVDIDLAPRFNVLAGDNGQGKTSVLEAAYLACTTRSFRTSKLAEVVREGATTGSAKILVDDGREEREQVVGVAGGTRRVTLAGKRPKSFAEYAVTSPVVAFHPGELSLSSGPAAGRRTLLDRVALFASPASADHLQRYGEAHRARQRILEQRGPAAPDLDVFEALMAEHGAKLGQQRADAAATLVGRLGAHFARITRGGLDLGATFAPGGPLTQDDLARALVAGRGRDAHRGSAGTGPHRDDLALALEGRAARASASQGEHRAITLALKLAELDAIAASRGVFPVLLLDDVSSELDADRTESLLDLLLETDAQILLTTTRPDLVATPSAAPADRRDFTVRAGVVESSGG